MARKILLADDSVTAQNMGRKILTDAGYEVITVNNGSAALKKIADSKPDLAVLDVYMPGYSGLEVCQRVKENRDTSHLPVLLTVGKLEPFKQDEARRVRADAFIVKPFEASELLAVLGKLEDKLVAPGPTKVSKSAPNTMETFERQARDGGPKYGDEDSGWKNRLKIPADGPKVTEVESESHSALGTPFRDLATAPANPPSPPEASGRDLPKDITADEVAALAAAMNRVKGTKAEPTSEVEGVTKESSDSDGKSEVSAAQVSGATGSSVRNSDPESLPEPTTFAQAESDGVDDAAVTEQFAASARESVSAMDQDVGEATRLVMAEKGSDAVANEGDTPAADAPIAAGSEHLIGKEASVEPPANAQFASEAASPAEIDAALSTISPAGEALASFPAQAEGITSTTASVSAGYTGPRWIAEEVPVEAAESVLVLEREMQKAYAAFAAHEHAASFYRYESAPVDREDEPGFAMAPVAIGGPAPISDVATANVEFSSESDSADSYTRAASAAEQVGSDTSLVTHADLDKAHHVSDLGFRDLTASDLPKPPAPPFAAAATVGGSDAGLAAFGTPQPFGVAETSATGEPVAIEDRLAPSVDRSPAFSGNPATEVSPASEAQREAEIAAATAAAWASWRDIRESLVNAKNASDSGAAIGDPVTETSEPRTPQDPAAELELIKQLRGLTTEKIMSGQNLDVAKSSTAVSKADSEPTENPNEIASIVDSMLAELRPKLVAEIARKLGKKDE